LAKLSASEAQHPGASFINPPVFRASAVKRRAKSEGISGQFPEQVQNARKFKGTIPPPLIHHGNDFIIKRPASLIRTRCGATKSLSRLFRHSTFHHSTFALGLPLRRCMSSRSENRRFPDRARGPARRRTFAIISHGPDAGKTTLDRCLELRRRKLLP